MYIAHAVVQYDVLMNVGILEIFAILGYFDICRVCISYAYRESVHLLKQGLHHSSVIKDSWDLEMGVADIMSKHTDNPCSLL